MDKNMSEVQILFHACENVDINVDSELTLYEIYLEIYFNSQISCIAWNKKLETRTTNRDVYRLL